MLKSEQVERILAGIERHLERCRREMTRRKLSHARREEMEAAFRRVIQSAQKVLHDMRFSSAWSWEDIPYAGIGEVRRHDRCHLPVIVRSAGIRIGETLCADGEDFAECVFTDFDTDERISSTPVLDPLLSQVQRLGRCNATLDILGFPTLIPAGDTGVSRYYFTPVEVRLVDTPLQIVRATPAECGWVREHLRDLDHRGMAPYTWLVSEAQRLSGIAGLEHCPELVELVEIKVLQALSDGYVVHAAGRISALVIGPPGSAKKLLQRVARIVNINYRHCGHKITAAGLIGAARYEAGGFVSKPGLIVQAHRGVLGLEDLHAVPPARLADVLGQVAQCLEDGVVYDSTAAKAEFRANTGLDLDLNRRRDLVPGSQAGGADIVVPNNILSRVDAIYELLADSGRQDATARAMIQDVKQVGPLFGSDLDEAIRRVRLTVAQLRTELPNLTVPASVRRYASTRMDALIESAGDHPIVRDQISIFRARMVNSMFKFASAHARGHGRRVMVSEDIDKAIGILSHKVDFIKTIDPATTHLFTPGKRERRQDQVRNQLGDRPFTTEAYRKITDVSRATAFRDVAALQDQGVLVKAGADHYRFAASPRMTVAGT